MHTVHGAAGASQSLGGGDVGEDHEFLDQAMAIITGAHADRLDIAGLTNHHLALRHLISSAPRRSRATRRAR